MRKSFLIFVMTSLLLSLCNTVSAQQPNSPVDIAASAKTVADSVAQITLPVSLPEGETIESFLLKHDGHKWTASLCLKKDTGMRSICVLLLSDKSLYDLAVC